MYWCAKGEESETKIYLATEGSKKRDRELMSGKHLQPTMNICKRENRCLIETVTGIINLKSDEEKEKC